jgi:ABC-type sugar transport system permease subunit
VALVAVVELYPTVQNFIMSFTKWDGMHSAELVGFDNYIKHLTDEKFYTSLLNNFKFVIATPIFVIIPLLIAVVVYNNIKGWKIIRSEVFIPYVIAITVVGALFSNILAFDGPLNNILKGIGLEELALNWLALPRTSIPAIIFAWFWKDFGFYTVIFIAALSTIPNDIYDSAKVDGANFFQTLIYITVPYMKKIISLAFVIAVISALKYMFDYVYIMTGGGPGYKTFTIEYFLYNEAFVSFRMGSACALAVLLFIIVFAASFMQIRIMGEE